MKNKVLITMLVSAVIALGFGFFVMNQRSQPISVDEPETNSDDTQNEQETVTPTPPAETPLTSTASWKVYENDKHGFSLRYPTNHTAGSISDNSVLGTFDSPVRGFHVGPLVLVVLKDATLKKEAQDYFNGVYNAALNPPASTGPEASPIECKVHKVTNSNVVSIKSTACDGEGGPAKYAYIEGAAYDVFVDGYSKGYDNSSNGEFAGEVDYLTVLSTFSFSADAQASTTPPASSPTSAASTPPATAPAIQFFTITADDAGANPAEIAAVKGAIVQITFNVAANVDSGGLDFKSSVVNSGTINAGQSKTISFKAADSFSFIPYLPGSQVAKDYTLKVNVK